MQLTTLDILIITFLATPKRFLSKAPGVELPRSVFEVHSQFVKRSLLFTKVIQKDVVRISIAEHSLHNDPWQEPSRLFAQKCSYWRSMYRQDRLLSFAESGFGALRLAENAELFSGLLFNKGRIAWNLQADTCYIDGKPQPGSGIKWAWDLFAVSQIAARECGLAWTQFGPQLASPHPPHILELGFSEDVNSPGTASYIPNGQFVLFSALDKYGTYPATYGPLQMVDRSSKAVFAGHELDFSRIGKLGKKMLWLAAKQQGRYVPLSQAYREVYGRKTTYIPNNCPTGSITNPLHAKYKLTPRKKIKLLSDTGDFVQHKLQEVIDTHALPYQVKIYTGKQGFQLRIIQLK